MGGSSAKIDWRETEVAISTKGGTWRYVDDVLAAGLESSGTNFLHFCQFAGYRSLARCTIKDPFHKSIPKLAAFGFGETKIGLQYARLLVCKYPDMRSKMHYLVVIIDASQRFELELGVADKEKEKDRAYVYTC